MLEHSTGPVFFALPGRLLKIAPDGTRTTVIDGLTRPTSVAIGPRRPLRLEPRQRGRDRRGIADRDVGESEAAIVVPVAAEMAILG